jgi:hypothetical protein
MNRLGGASSKREVLPAAAAAVPSMCNTYALLLPVARSVNASDVPMMQKTLIYATVVARYQYMEPPNQARPQEGRNRGDGN